jgi:hypothetical protein
MERQHARGCCDRLDDTEDGDRWRGAIGAKDGDAPAKHGKHGDQRDEGQSQQQKECRHNCPYQKWRALHWSQCG